MINKEERDMFEFTEWIGTYFIKMHGGWMRNYADQRDKDNLMSTEYLYDEYLGSKNAMDRLLKRIDMGKVISYVEWIKNDENDINYEKIINIMKNEGWKEFEREEAEETPDRIWWSVSMYRKF